MKSLKPLYFVAGMTGMFSMAAPTQAEWFLTLPASQSSALAILLALFCAALLTWLTQFRRRHVGPPGLLRCFAVNGLLVALLLPVEAMALLPAPADGFVVTALRLALFVFFCLVAVRTQPATEQLEAAL